MTRFHTTAEGNIPFTEEEEAEWNAMAAQHQITQAELARTQYRRDRAAEYPPITDYLDGIVKGDQLQVQAYIDACLVVKAKYPKG
jgi:hypothetical protein